MLITNDTQCISFIWRGLCDNPLSQLTDSDERDRDMNQVDCRHSTAILYASNQFDL